MSGSRASSSTAKLPRGRRPAARVPCDDCIQRASENNEGNIELCEKCRAVLHRPRKPQKETINARRVRRQSHAIIDTALGIRTEQATLPFSSDGQEQHALEFFVKHSAPQLAGYFDSPFWQKMVLVAARDEPSVLHAVIAIGALHESLLSGAVSFAESQDGRTRSVLGQCNESIKHLIESNAAKERPDLRLMLTTCVLYTCFEALLGNYDQAILHAAQGYNLLQQYAVDPGNERWDAAGLVFELDQLCQIIQRLQIHIQGLMGQHTSTLPNVEPLSFPEPTFLASLHDAQASLERVLNQLTVFFLRLELSDQYYAIAAQSEGNLLIFSSWLEAWEASFSDLLVRTQQQMSPDDRRAAMILKAHHLVAEVLAGVDLSLGELGWEAFNDKFQAIVNLATAVLEHTAQSDKSIIEARWKTSGVFGPSTLATLSFSLGIVDPLYEVVARCRDPMLRRKALELLATHPRQDCMWSSWSAWKIGKLLIHLEEVGIHEQAATTFDIPAERQIQEGWLGISDEYMDKQAGKQKVAYTRAVPRVSARRALNPGLFDWRSEVPNFIPSLNFATVPVSKDHPTNLEAEGSQTRMEG